MWSEREDEIIGGDLTAALGYVTPAGGVVLTPVAPVGLRDRAAGTVGFTTSLGFGRKLDRIKQNPRVALAYHAREHGFARTGDFVLVQGTANYETEPDRDYLEGTLGPAAERFMGKPRRGPFWDRWLSAYYADRVLVSVQVERVVRWEDPACRGEPSVTGAPLPEQDPPSQEPPGKGTAPRVDVERERRRLQRLPHLLAGWTGTDGLPMCVPVSLGAASAAGLALDGPLPPGARRAGVLAHSYRAELVGLNTRQYTGWLQDGVYAPHTAGGFRAPANKTLLLLANGLMARRGLAKARAMGRA